jgi:hypothetical protein
VRTARLPDCLPACFCLRACVGGSQLRARALLTSARPRAGGRGGAFNCSIADTYKMYTCMEGRIRGLKTVTQLRRLHADQTSRWTQASSVNSLKQYRGVPGCPNATNIVVEYCTLNAFRVTHNTQRASQRASQRALRLSPARPRTSPLPLHR